MVGMEVTYCTVQDVINITRTSPEKIGITESDDAEEEFNNIICRWIQYATALINNYTRSPLTSTDIEFDTTRKLIYEDVCTRIVANRIALSEAYKNYAVLTVDNWELGKIPENIFGNDLKGLLDKYKLEEESIKSRVDVGVITGADLWK